MPLHMTRSQTLTEALQTPSGARLNEKGGKQKELPVQQAELAEKFPVLRIFFGNMETSGARCSSGQSLSAFCMKRQCGRSL
jgi:hypothetical protein